MTANKSSDEKDLIARTFKSAFNHHAISEDTLTWLVKIVLYFATESASATVLKGIANQQVRNIRSLQRYSLKNYNLYMERAWGGWYIFSVSQAIDDYIHAWKEFKDDLHLSSWTHYIYYPQGIWHNEEMEQLQQSSDDE